MHPHHREQAYYAHGTNQTTQHRATTHIAQNLRWPLAEPKRRERAAALLPMRVDQPLRNLPQMWSSTTKAMNSRLSTSTVVGPLRTRAKQHRRG